MGTLPIPLKTLNRHIINIFCATALITGAFCSFAACADEPAAQNSSARQAQADAVKRQLAQLEAQKRAELAAYQSFAAHCQQLNALLSAPYDAKRQPDLSPYSAIKNSDVQPFSPTDALLEDEKVQRAPGVSINAPNPCAQLIELCNAPSVSPQIQWRNAPSIALLCSEFSTICKRLENDYDTNSTPNDGALLSGDIRLNFPTLFAPFFDRFKGNLHRILTCESQSHADAPSMYHALYEDDLERFVAELGVTYADEATRAEDKPRLAKRRAPTLSCADENCSQFIEALDQFVSPSEAALRFAIDSFKTILDNQTVTREDLLADELNAFFHSDHLSPQEKLAVYIDLLPALIAHAEMSDDPVTMRKLYASYQSLRRAPNPQALRVTCTQSDAIKSMEIAFDLSVTQNHSAPSESHVQLLCPDPRWLDGIDAATLPMENLENEFASQTTIVCRASTTPYSSKPNIPLIRSQLRMALRTKDNMAIAQGLIELSQALESLANRFESLPDDDFCPTVTLYMTALSHDRFAELHFLERQLKRLFHDNFADRLAKFSECKTDPDQSTAAQAQLLWDEYGELYSWITTHFRGKEIKKLDKSFRSWTRSRRLSTTQPRRMIAAWTAWTLGDYARAYRFSDGMTKKKPRTIHLQIHAFDTMLKFANAVPVDQEYLESYLYTTMLKTPSLPYQMFTAISDLISEDEKRRVTQLMRSYNPSISPAAAAQFFVAYSDVLAESLTPKQIVETGAWIDTEIATGESPCATIKRRLDWAAQAAQIGELDTVAKRALDFSADPSALTSTKQLWKQIACVAQAPDETDIVESCQKLYPSRRAFDLCQTQKCSSVDDYWRNAPLCW